MCRILKACEYSICTPEASKIKVVPLEPKARFLLHKQSYLINISIQIYKFEMTFKISPLSIKRNIHYIGGVRN